MKGTMEGLVSLELTGLICNAVYVGDSMCTMIQDVQCLLRVRKSLIINNMTRINDSFSNLDIHCISIESVNWDSKTGDMQHSSLSGG